MLCHEVEIQLHLYNNQKTIVKTFCHNSNSITGESIWKNFIVTLIFCRVRFHYIELSFVDVSAVRVMGYKINDPFLRGFLQSIELKFDSRLNGTAK